jgi:Putative prokaryotic signal transducing protein
MEAQADFFTVFRSMDATAKEDCDLLVEQLSAAGLHPVLLDDRAPGVPEGVFEVRVPTGEAAQAEQITTAATIPLSGEAVFGDDSESLDLETIAHTSEVEALGIQGLLEANGIPAVLVGDAVLPNLPFEVRVAHDQVHQSRELMAEAEKDGPAAAAEAFGASAESPANG